MNRAVLDRQDQAKSAGLMSYAEFLATDFENPHVEWVEGRVVAMSPSNELHQDLAGFLLVILRQFVREKNLGAVLFDPFQMKTGPNLPGRAPDILFVSNAHKKRLKKTHLDGPADLVVEIVSPDSRARDRGEKFYEYEEGGVREYWVIDPQRKRAEFYLLNRRGIYEPATLDKEGAFHSTALKGVWIKVSWLWQSPLPSEISIMRMWRLI